MADVVGGMVLHLPLVGSSVGIVFPAAVLRHCLYFPAVFKRDILSQIPVEYIYEIHQETPVELRRDKFIELVHKRLLLGFQQVRGKFSDSLSPFEGGA